MCMKCEMEDKKLQEIRHREVAAMRERMRDVSTPGVLAICDMLETSTTVSISGGPTRRCRTRDEALDFLAFFFWRLNDAKSQLEGIILSQLPLPAHAGAA